MSYVHIHAPRGYYIGQTRRYGYRLWNTVTGRCKTAEAAMSKAVLTMSHNDKRARVLFITFDGWYEPSIVMEAAR